MTGRQKRWTATNDADLRLFYGRYRTSLVAWVLGRSMGSVWMRAHFLKLRFNRVVP